MDAMCARFGRRTSVGLPWFPLFCVLLALTVAAPLARAQQPAQSAATPAAASAAPKPPDISKEAVVVDKLATNVREEADGTGTRETIARIRVLADAGVKQFAVLAFTYTASNQQTDISYVRVLKPDGSVVVTPDYNVQDLPADVTRQAPMYSDIHQKHVAVKGLGVGDTLEYKVTLRTLKPEVPGHFWLEYSFEKNIIILDEQLDLDIPGDKPVTVASADVQPTVTTANGRKLYHWASRNLSRPDPNAPPKSTKKWKPSVQVTTFANWEQVGAWYQSLAKDQISVTPAIQTRADALIKGLTSDDDKIRAIFNAVALQIHYVGLEFGIGRYQPHLADDVLSNEYGDCKDKHTLLAALLKAEGFEAWPVLINSGRELDPATPSPAQFDHVITAVPRGDKLLWMDSTEEVAPVGMLMLPLRNKQALAVPTRKMAYLEHTPADLPFPQVARFEATGKLDDKGQFTGHIAQSYRGDVALVMRASFRAVPESQWKEFLQQYSSNTGFGGEVKSPVVSPVEKTDEPFTFSYDYTREHYSEWSDHRIGPPMPPVGWELMPGIKQTKPADDPEIGSPGEQIYTTSVQLPSGWHLFPPDGINLVEDWAEYHSKYGFANGTFTAERRLVYKKNKVSLADWDKYLRFREAIYEDSSRMASISGPCTPVQGLPKTTEPGSRPYDSAASAEAQSAEVQRLLEQIEPVRDAIALLSAEPTPAAADLADATEKCRRVVDEFEAQSHQYGPGNLRALSWAQMLGAGWTCLGWAEFENHNQPAAESYLRSAWKLSQNPAAGYQLARLLEAKGDKTAAAHIYEFAYISNPGGLMNNIGQTDDLNKKIAASYKNLTGREISATPLNHGRYEGSLRAELDKDTEIRGYVRQTRLNGQALFAVTYESNKPVKATLIGGDESLAPLASTLEDRRLPVTLPTGSKARVVREVRMICSPWGGCDAYMLLPTAIEIPTKKNVIEVASPPDAPKGTKTVRMINAPSERN
jgi:hypothetical protein